MPLPDSLHGNTYYERLSALRDGALVQSRAYGMRKRLGWCAWGRAHAEWEGQSGSTIHLDEQGVRIGTTTLLDLHPTTMRIFTNYGSGGEEIVEYCMDLDSTGDIEVFRYMLTTGSLGEAIRAGASRRADRRYQMAVPTDEQLALVYTEMERGASGLYALRR